MVKAARRVDKSYPFFFQGLAARVTTKALDCSVDWRSIYIELFFNKFEEVNKVEGACFEDRLAFKRDQRVWQIKCL